MKFGYEVVFKNEKNPVSILTSRFISSELKEQNEKTATYVVSSDVNLEQLFDTADCVISYSTLPL